MGIDEAIKPAAMLAHPAERVPTLEVATVPNHTTTPNYCYVYIVQSESGAVKIGISNNVRARLRELQVGNHEALSLAYSLRVADKETALLLESALHARYPTQKLRGEWFSVNAAQVVADIRFAVAICRIVSAVEYFEIVLTSQVDGVYDIAEMTESQRSVSNAIHEDDEFVYTQSVDLVRRFNKASTSLLQRRLRIGHGRATRIMDMMFQRGVIGAPTEHYELRKVLPYEK